MQLRAAPARLAAAPLRSRASLRRVIAQRAVAPRRTLVSAALTTRADETGAVSLASWASLAQAAPATALRPWSEFLTPQACSTAL